MSENYYKNEYDTTGECSHRGLSAELLFEECMKNRKVKFRPATKQEQYEHIDYFLFDNSRKIYTTVDVKAAKKQSRYDSDTSDDIIWVEFKGVSGYPGWLYGKAKYIAFHKPSEDCFYLVETKKLAALCEKLCVGTAYSASQAFHKRYRRSGRLDEISIISFEDLKYLEKVTKLSLH